MSGAHAQHRVGNRPLIIAGIAIPKVDKNGNPAMRWVSKPGGTYENGRSSSGPTPRSSLPGMSWTTGPSPPS